MSEAEERERLRYLQLKAKAAGASAQAPDVPAESGGFLEEAKKGARGLSVGTAQGATLGFFDELAGLAGKALLPKRIELGAAATPEMRAEQEAQPTNYQIVRDRVRGEVAKAQKESPKLFFTGEILGGAALPAGAAKGAATGARALGRAVAAGAGTGTAAGLGYSDADVTEGEVGEAATDAALGTGLGLAGGAVGYGVARAAPTLLRRAGAGLERLGLRQARRVLQGGADIRSGTKKPMSDEAAREALRSGAILPLGTTEGAARRIEARADALGKVYGEVVEELERRGVPGPNARTLANRLLAEADNLEPTVLDQAPVRAYRKAAEDILDASELGERRGIAPTGRLGFSQAELLKRDAQSAAKAEYQKLGGSKPLGNAKKGIAATLRESIEETVDEAGQKAGPGTEVAELAESFRPVKQRLSRLLEAEEFAKSGASRASQRNAMGLADRIAFMGALTTGGAGAALGSAGGMALGRSLLNRGASTAAVGAYGAGRAANFLGGQALRIPERGVHGARLGSALERGIYDPDGPMDEETARRLAVIEALRRKK